MIRWTPFRRYALITLALIAGVVGVGALLKHEPLFYRRVAVPPGHARGELSNDFFVKGFMPLVVNLAGGVDEDWRHSYTQDHINSFFEEDFVRFGDADHFRKMGISDPRVEISEDRLRLGFRFGSGLWSTILSYDLKIWVAKREVNVIAVEVQRRRAGAMPFPTQQVFNELTELGKRHNVEVTWYRLGANPVAIVKVQSDRPRPVAQFTDISLRTGVLNVQGFSIDPTRAPLENEPSKKAPILAQ